MIPERNPWTFSKSNSWIFEQPDLQRFPCLRLAYQAIDAGGIMPTILNAANEIAVEAFLQKQIRFTDIPVVIEKCMQKFNSEKADSLDTILQADNSARDISRTITQQLKH